MLSTIISAYNNDDLICLHAKQCQEGFLIPDEIIIINDGGDDSLLMKLEKIQWLTKVIYAKILEDIPWNQVGAENLGVLISTGDILAMEDADHIPSKELYREAVTTLIEHPEIAHLRSRRVACTVENFPRSITHPVHIGSATKIIRRKALVSIKCGNEDLAGNYGYVDLDYRHRLEMGKWKTCITNSVYYVALDGLTATLSRDSNVNRLKYAEAIKHSQPKGGMIRFNYEMKELS